MAGFSHVSTVRSSWLIVLLATAIVQLSCVVGLIQSGNSSVSASSTKSPIGGKDPCPSDHDHQRKFATACCWSDEDRKPAWCHDHIDRKKCCDEIDQGDHLPCLLCGKSESAKALIRRDIIEDVTECLNKIITNIINLKFELPRECCKLPLIGALPACNQGSYKYLNKGTYTKDLAQSDEY